MLSSATQSKKKWRGRWRKEMTEWGVTQVSLRSCNLKAHKPVSITGCCKTLCTWRLSSRGRWFSPNATLAEQQWVATMTNIKGEFSMTREPQATRMNVWRQCINLKVERMKQINSNYCMYNHSIFDFFACKVGVGGTSNAVTLGHHSLLIWLKVIFV